ATQLISWSVIGRFAYGRASRYDYLVRAGADRGFCERHFPRDRRRTTSRQPATTLVAVRTLYPGFDGTGAGRRRRHRGVARSPAFRAWRAGDALCLGAVAGPRREGWRSRQGVRRGCAGRRGIRYPRLVRGGRAAGEIRRSKGGRGDL